VVTGGISLVDVNCALSVSVGLAAISCVFVGGDTTVAIDTGALKRLQEMTIHAANRDKVMR
jgi:hypothetical protein